MQQYIDRAIELIKKGWCKHAIARDDDGEDCDATCAGASHWCLIGALHRAHFDLGGSLEMEDLYGHVAEEIPLVYGLALGLFNDAPDTNKEDVIRVLTRAKENLK